MERDQARLLILDEPLRHARICDLPAIISDKIGPRTLLVLNDTKVLPARLRGYKVHVGEAAGAGGRVELLLLRAEALGMRWRAMYRASKPLRNGQAVRLVAPDGSDGPLVTVADAAHGEATIDFGPLSAEDFDALLERVGEVPLPPYIERARERAGESFDRDEDRQRYQTVYARIAGSVAAPTAGLHFTPGLLANLRAAGHDCVTITLHVGPGTFLPLRSDSIEAHVMHPESYHISEETAAAILAARAAGRKVLAVGTTVVRALESAVSEDGSVLRAGFGETRLFIYPPYCFRTIDALLTNFHLPRSTLLMLVAALTGQKRLLDAYATAVALGYRFYSFGDAMLIPHGFADAMTSQGAAR